MDSGIDASLVFESDRAGNSGLFVNDTLKFTANVNLPGLFAKFWLNFLDHICISQCSRSHRSGKSYSIVSILSNSKICRVS